MLDYSADKEYNITIRKGECIMKDLTGLFRKGIENGTGYDDYDVQKAVSTLPGISCDLDDEGANWRLILKGACTKEAHILGFLSRYYPVALLVGNCPNELTEKLREKNVAAEFFGSDCPKRDVIKYEERELVQYRFDESFSCDEEILRKYAPFKRIMDDRFLDDGDFSPDDERLSFIYDKIPYITPYSFTFDEIR